MTSSRFTWFFFLTLVAAILYGTVTLYRGDTVYFPRQSSEFRAADRREAVRAAAEAVLEKDPARISAWIDLMLARYEEGPDQYIPALEALEKARDLGALDVRLFYYAGVMYEAKGLPDYAVLDFERFLRHRPGDSDVRMRLANLSYRLGNLDRAAECYKEILKTNADPVTAFNLALVYRDLQKWNEGLEVLNGLLEKGKVLPPGGFKLMGDLYYGMGDAREAVSHYTREAVLSKDNEELVRALAMAHEQLGEHEQALIYWKRVCELNPKDTRAPKRIRSLRQKMRVKGKSS